MCTPQLSLLKSLKDATCSQVHGANMCPTCCMTCTLGPYIAQNHSDVNASMLRHDKHRGTSCNRVSSSPCALRSDTSSSHSVQSKDSACIHQWSMHNTVENELGHGSMRGHHYPHFRGQFNLHLIALVHVLWVHLTRESNAHQDAMPMQRSGLMHKLILILCLSPRISPP